MDNNCKNFIDKLVAFHPVIESRLSEIAEYWQPDEPPITILFGEIGRKIAMDFLGDAANVKEGLFNLIEAGMAENGLLLTAIATGLIESAVSALGKDEAGRNRFLQRLGEKSRKHAEAWLS